MNNTDKEIEAAYQKAEREHAPLGMSRRQAFLAGIAHKQENEWVKLADMPEGWKDGRYLDLWVCEPNKEPFRLAGAKYRKPAIPGFDNFGTWNYRVGIDCVTHVRLPPQPPKE